MSLVEPDAHLAGRRMFMAQRAESKLEVYGEEGMKVNVIEILIATLLLAVSVAAQENPRHGPRYHMYDLGTLGGPSSGVGGEIVPLNEHGVVVGGSQTSAANPDAGDPHPLFGPNDYEQRAFVWRRRSLHDLGTLPNGHNSIAVAINNAGAIVGLSDNGATDPQLGFPEAFGVLWSHGRIHNLGALGGNQSFAVAINDREQVTGVAENDVPDPFSIYGPGGTEAHAFLWEYGVMSDLGTLGGPDSWGFFVNERGQVAGFSLTPNLSIHPFLWNKGSMIDLGSLGGTFGQPNALNNRGQVSGVMNLVGDVDNHPFLWSRGRLRDLGTFGGADGEALWMNEAGEVVGEADYPIPCSPNCGHPQVYRPFLWRNGVMTDLGAVAGDVCGSAYGINSRTQVVGSNGICHGGIDAFLWERGHIYNLNDLVPSNSPLHLVYALYINDRGEITGTGVPPGVSVYDVDTLGHVFLLVPCEGGRCGDEDSTEKTRQGPVVSSVPSRSQSQEGIPKEMMRRFLGRRIPR